MTLLIVNFEMLSLVNVLMMFSYLLNQIRNGLNSVFSYPILSKIQVINTCTGESKCC